MAFITVKRIYLDLIGRLHVAVIAGKLPTQTGNSCGYRQWIVGKLTCHTCNFKRIGPQRSHYSGKSCYLKKFLQFNRI